MKALYIDCGMGAAGDMLTAALLELLPEPEKFVERLNALGIPGVEYRAVPCVKCGIKGTRMEVLVNGEEECADEHGHHHEHAHDGTHINEHRSEHPHEELRGHCHEEHTHDEAHEHGHEHAHTHEHACGGHHRHAGMADIEAVFARLDMPEAAKADALAVYKIIAEAESAVHGVPVTEIHFHEVGAMDAVADITAVCLLMDRLAPERVVVSPVHVGSGQVRCAHGVLPVPAPATAYLLRGVPAYGGSVRGELCTPTGAALLTQFASEFGPMPLMRVEAVGYGMGKKDFEAANCVRAMLGAAEDAPEAVLELQCNLDDMTAEAVGFAMERLLDAGALDVWTTPIGMKKSRPAMLLSVLCRESDREKLLPVLFRHTTTLGVREQRLRRHTLTRGISVCETPHGPVRVKTAEGFGVRRSKPEYEDLAQIARETGCSLAEAAALLGK